MRLRRFSQLGWLGCQDLAGFVMGEEVERAELGPPPQMVGDVREVGTDKWYWVSGSHQLGEWEIE